MAERPVNFSEDLGRILREDPRYNADAYLFVLDALHFTVRSLGRHEKKKREERHVTGRELLEGIRRYALKEYGPMARAVLEHWGVRRCEDFGEIVFSLVENGLLSKTERDSRKDFRGGYDFGKVFDAPFEAT